MSKGCPDCRVDEQPQDVVAPIPRMPLDTEIEDFFRGAFVVVSIIRLKDLEQAYLQARETIEALRKERSCDDCSDDGEMSSWWSAKIKHAFEERRTPEYLAWKQLQDTRRHCSELVKRLRDARTTIEALGEEVARLKKWV